MAVLCEADMSQETHIRSTEILCVCSGKGGVGKTLFSSCLGYALTRAGLRVLMIDGDLATDGLSLFLLGPQGVQFVKSLSPLNTLAGVMANYCATGTLQYQARQIYRTGPQDHGVIYDALISGRFLYGPESDGSSATASLTTPAPVTTVPGVTSDTATTPATSVSPSAIPAVDQATFRSAVSELFNALRKSGEYDYVIVDTRGGFAFESTDLCRLADSFLVVIEADPTSFYQTVNLVQRIEAAANDSGSKSVLRGFLVNKAVDGLPATGELDLSKVEWSFRNALCRQFPIFKYSDTYPIPADLQVLQSYKSQMVPFLGTPASLFTYVTLTAYSNIFQVVTSRWSKEQVQGWQGLVNSVAEAINLRNEDADKAREAREAEDAAIKRLRETSAQNEQRIRDLKAQIEQLRKEVDLAHAQAAAELSRASAVESLIRSVSNERAKESAPAKSRFTPIVFIAVLTVVTVLAIAFFLIWQSNAREKAVRQVPQTAEQARPPQSQAQAPASGPAPALPQAAAGPRNGATTIPGNTHPVTKSTRSNSGSGGVSGTAGAGSGPTSASSVGSLSVGPAQSIRVYIHAADSSQAELVQKFEAELASAGVKVAGFDVGQYKGTLKATEVHYYRDDSQSISDVGMIQKILGGSGTPVIARQVTDSEQLQPRTYGLWLYTGRQLIRD